MAHKVSSGTASWTASTRTISGATMTPVFEAADATFQRQVLFTIGTTLYYGRVATFVGAGEVTLLNWGELPGSDGTIVDVFLLDLDDEHSYQDYLDELASMIKDGETKLSSDDKDAILAKAVRDYSHHKPFWVKKKVEGNGTQEYLLSTIFGSLWKHGFSQVRSIEYPFGEVPKSMLDRDQWEIYDDGTAQDGSNLKLRFIDDVPQAGQYFVAEFSIEMDLPKAGAQNFPDTDENFTNITTLGAVYACQRLAAVYAQSMDSSISVDVVNYGDKSGRYQALARQYLRQYNLMVFGTEEPDLSLEAGVSLKVTEPVLETGGKRLFHRRRHLA